MFKQLFFFPLTVWGVYVSVDFGLLVRTNVIAYRFISYLIFLMNFYGLSITLLYADACLTLSHLSQKERERD